MSNKKVPDTSKLVVTSTLASADSVTVDTLVSNSATQSEAEVAEPTAVAPSEAPAAAPESPVVVPAAEGPGDGDAPVARDESAPLEEPSEEVVQVLRPCDLSIKPIEDSKLLSVTHLPSGEVREMTREELNQLLRG